MTMAVETTPDTEEAIPMATTRSTNTVVYAERRKHPLLAGFLSLMPGLGQVYVGYYRRGFTNILVVAAVIALLSSNDAASLEPFLGVFLGFFWMFNLIDAARIANLYNDAVAGMAPEDLRRELVLTGRGGSIAGGIGLIALGTLLFMHTMFDVSLAWLKDWWPAAPIGFGVYLLVRGIQDRRARAGVADPR
jgi:hypothetical protein